MSNIILVKKEQARIIKRDGRGAVIRITKEAADTLESMLSETYAGSLSICKLASNLIEYAAKDTVIRWEDEE